MRTRVAFLLLLQLLSVGTGSALFGKKKGKERRRLTEVNEAEIDHDAAMGTVRNILTSEEKEAQEAAKHENICDAQMAKSLVKANDAMLIAISERDEAQKAKMKDNEAIQSLQDKVKDLESTLQTIESSHMKTVSKLEAQVLSVQQEKDAKVNDISGERGLLQKAFDGEREEKEKGIAKIQELESNVENLEITISENEATLAELEQKLEGSRRAWDNEREEKEKGIAKIQELESNVEKLEITISENEATLAELQQEIEVSRRAIQSEMDAKLEQLRNERDSILVQKDSELVELQQRFDTEIEQAEAALIKTKEEAKKYTISQANAIRQEKEDLKKEHDDERAKMQATVDALSEKSTKIEEAKKELEISLGEAKVELEEWKKAFNSRTYCNLTLIGDDLYYAGQVAIGQTKRVAVTAAAEVDRNIRYYYGYYSAKVKVKSGEMMLKSSELYSASMKQTAIIYNEQVNALWPKVKPHYDKHVGPLVNRCIAWKKVEVDPRLQSAISKFLEFKTKEIEPRFDTAVKKLEDTTSKVLEFKVEEIEPRLDTAMKKLEEFKKTQLYPRYEEWKAKSKNQFKRVAKTYAKHCKESLKLARQLAKEKSIPLETTIGPYWNDSCRNPEESIINFGYGCLIMFVFLFRRRIFRMILGTFGFLWKTFVAFTPLRLFITRKKLNDTQVNGTDGVEKVKKSQPVKKARTVGVLQ